MVVSLVSEQIQIQSHKGPYSVLFNEHLLSDFPLFGGKELHFLIDSNIARLYASPFEFVVNHRNSIQIDAKEDNKTLEKIIPVIETLVTNGIRRDHILVAIGGGIVQDITCFISSVLLRGVSWRFIPTTLLAQADSCIGSKSSVNLKDTKNIIGTFNPPAEIHICTQFLDTLEKKDIHSGIGEIIKVHAIDGIDSFNSLAKDFDQLFTDRSLLRRYICEALLIKKRFIEEDEFDQGIRNIFNYGHSFGHSIESATDYAIPHGVAVTIGMDMANFISAKRGLLPHRDFERMHEILNKNYSDFSKVNIPIERVMGALKKDKKNTSSMLGLIFAVGEKADIQRIQVPPDSEFQSQCEEFLRELKA